jgi:hypothetical protein
MTADHARQITAFSAHLEKMALLPPEDHKKGR